MVDYVAFDTTAEPGHQRLNWQWIALWALGNILALPLFGAIAIGLVSTFPVGGVGLSAVPAFTLAGMIGGAITGSLVGMGQRLLLRPWVSWAERWIPATLVGWVLGGAIWATLEWLLNDIQIQVLGQDTNIRSLVSATLGGFGIGLGQWLVLRARARLSSLWVIITTIGWAIGWILAELFESLILTMGGQEAINSLLVAILFISGILILAGGSAGIITGIAMKTLVSRYSKGIHLS